MGASTVEDAAGRRGPAVSLSGVVSSVGCRRSPGLVAWLDYDRGMLSLEELARHLGARLVLPSTGDAPAIARVAEPARADATSLVFAEDAASLERALRSAAGAVLVSQSATIPQPVTKALLLAAQPRLAFARAGRLLQPRSVRRGIHATAIVPASAQVADTAAIDAYAVLGESVAIGENSKIGAGCVIADGCHVGADCILHPRVVLYGGVTLGDRVVVHAGAVLGSDGFGYVRDAATGEYLQFPQQGTLAIEDDVEIGANTTVDRSALAETRIERGAKLDNLVHVGHNVVIGRNVVIAAQTGISGSSTVGEGAILGGQVGVGEHADIGADVILGGGAGVLSKKKLRGPGQVFWGRPAQPLRAYLRSLAALAKLAAKQKD